RADPPSATEHQEVAVIRREMRAAAVPLLPCEHLHIHTAFLSGIPGKSDGLVVAVVLPLDLVGSKQRECGRIATVPGGVSLSHGRAGCRPNARDEIGGGLVFRTVPMNLVGVIDGERSF